MNAYTFYRQFLKQLQNFYSSGESAVITDLVFEKFADLKKIDLIKFPDLILSELQFKDLNDALKQLFDLKPVQYVVGEAWFYKLKFIVNPSVLIPRPETEELVSMIIDFAKLNSVKTIIDIGTGSGCIPISIKNNVPALNVTSLDISAKALVTASQNAIANEVEINFIKLDFLNENKWKELEKYDIIVSNPPYIPYSESNLIPKNVKEYEPEVALFVDEALIFYKKIAQFGKSHLKINGKIFMEVHEDFANQVLQHFIEESYAAKIIIDILDKKRFVVANNFSTFII